MYLSSRKNNNARWVNIRLDSIVNNAGSGHVFFFHPSHFSTFNIFVTQIDQKSTSSSVLYTRATTGGGIYDSYIGGQWWRIWNNVTASPIDLEADAAVINDNLFEIRRITSTVPDSLPLAIRLASSTSSLLWFNRIVGTNFQNPTNGAIELLGCFGTTISDCYMWDTQTYQNDIIYLSKMTGGTDTTRTSIYNYYRPAGNLNGNYDVKVVSAQDTTLVDCYAPTFNIDANKRNLVIVNGKNITVTNQENLATSIIETTGVSQFASVKASKQVIRRIGFKEISSGSFAVTGSLHVVDAEGAASTDDLDTITGGEDGMIVILVPQAGRSITVKHNTGNIRLSGGADFLLDNVRHTLTLMYYATYSAWVEISRADAV